MAVYRLFKDKAFEPEAIATMTSAYAEVCRALGLHGRDRSEVNAVAKKIIEFAQRGERDPVRLRESVLQALQHQTKNHSQAGKGDGRPERISPVTRRIPV